MGSDTYRSPMVRFARVLKGVAVRLIQTILCGAVNQFGTKVTAAARLMYIFRNRRRVMMLESRIW